MAGWADDAIGKSERLEAREEDVAEQIKRLAARSRTSEGAISGRLTEDQKARVDRKSVV